MSALVLGLGLFFLGMQLVGENLRRLTGRSFRKAIRRIGEEPGFEALTGLGFGALMQSATAVTFILASMMKSGLVTASSAAPVILWSNVGLTALAFIATLDIHPLVAYFVGLSGIFSAMIRKGAWRAVAGLLLGVGLILFGLESMSAGAEPLKNAAWFTDLMAQTVGSPFVAFGAGILAAAILQSNTGAAMLVITLAGAGALDLDQAAMLIYGANLGAIALRVALSLNLDRASQRLVRFEDIFCIWSGVLMSGLFLIERTGVPLVLHGAGLLAPSHIEIQLALIFLLSNLLPALGMSGFCGRVLGLLDRWLPGEAEGALGVPKFLSDPALDDPATAMDMMSRELSRLLASIEIKPEALDWTSEEEAESIPGFGQLSGAIERFGARLASKSTLHEAEAHELHLQRAELGLIRYIAAAVREFNGALFDAQSAGRPASATEHLADSLRSLVAEAVDAARTLKPETVRSLRARSKRHGEFVKAVVGESFALCGGGAVPPPAEIAMLADAFELAAWMLHRLSKILDRSQATA